MVSKLVVEQVGDNYDVLRTVRLHPRCRYIWISLEYADDDKQPCREESAFPPWDPKRKVSNLPEPPLEVR